MKIQGEQYITKLFDVSKFKVVVGLSQKHEESTNNCGLFAIAVNDPSQVVFVENEMQNHFKPVKY